MPIVRRSLVALPMAVVIAGCTAEPKQVRMVDPRTGVIAICMTGQSDVAKPDTILAAVTQFDPCIDELSYYGFQDENALLVAAKPR